MKDLAPKRSGVFALETLSLKAPHWEAALDHLQHIEELTYSSFRVPEREEDSGASIRTVHPSNTSKIPRAQPDYTRVTKMWENVYYIHSNSTRFI